MLGAFRQFAKCVLIAGMLLGSGAAVAQETIKIAFIAPFSGAFAANGDAWLKMLRYAMDNTNARGGALGKKFELDVR